MFFFICHCFFSIQGGLTYLGIKGLLSVTYQEMRYARACSRTVKDFEERD